MRDLPIGGEERVNNGVRGSVCDGGRGGSDIVWLKWSKERCAKKQGQIRPPGGLLEEKLLNKKKKGRSAPGQKKRTPLVILPSFEPYIESVQVWLVFCVSLSREKTSR